MTQFYVPSILIVILSWVAFWISPDAFTARVIIGLLTILTMATQNKNAREQIPRVSYITALDVWTSACVIFVFASLLEFAVVSMYTTISKKSTEEKMEEKVRTLCIYTCVASNIEVLANKEFVAMYFFRRRTCKEGYYAESVWTMCPFASGIKASLENLRGSLTMNY